MSKGLLEDARKYLALGWSVIPAHTVREDGQCSCGRDDCQAPGKHPRVKWAAYQERRPTEAELIMWFRLWPDANLAVVTGRVSGIVVLDVDLRRGGNESLYELFPEWPTTPIAITGGGGYHLYFKHPGETVPNGANVLPGLDVRGDGGYVIVPPSRHHSGRAYEWEIGHSPWEVSPIELAPEIQEALKMPGTLGRRAEPFNPEEMLTRIIPVGERDVTLTRYAGWLFRQQEVLDPIEVLDKLSWFNQHRVAEPLPEAQIKKIVRSIYKRELRRREAAEVARKAADAEEPVLQEMEGSITPADREAVHRAAWELIGLNGFAVRATKCYRMGEKVFFKLELADGTTVPLGDDLLSQAAVTKAIANHLHVVLPHRKPSEWRQLMSPIIQTVIDEEAEPSPAEQIEDWLGHWFEDDPPQTFGDDERDEVHEYFRAGHPVIFNGYLWIRPSRFLMYVTARLGVQIRMPELLRYLKEAGFERAWMWTGKDRSEKNRNIRGWRRPARGATSWLPEVDR